MDYGIKVSKIGKNVLGVNSKDTKSIGSSIQDVYKALALAYYNGAVTQVQRYRVAALGLSHDNAVMAVCNCFHEVSCLLEDLNSIAIYCEKAGEIHDSHDLWKKARNHIRHGIREDFDKESKKQKLDSYDYFALPPDLQISIGLDKEAFMISGKLIELSMIEDYLGWAKRIIDSIFRELEATEKTN